MKSLRYIALFFLMAVATSAAPANLTPYKLPARHAASSYDTSCELIASACEAIREASPFAAMAQVENENAADSEEIDKITHYAAKFLGTRYRLGAAGPCQFDCSGFVGYVYRNFGYNLHRDSRSQYRQGDEVDKDDLRPGDLLFFSSRSSGRGRVGHVAMVVDVNSDGSCTFIHASSSKKGVVYQRFPDNGYYSRNFIGAKRIVGASRV